MNNNTIHILYMKTNKLYFSALLAVGMAVTGCSSDEPAKLLGVVPEMPLTEVQSRTAGEVANINESLFIGSNRAAEADENVVCSPLAALQLVTMHTLLDGKMTDPLLHFLGCTDIDALNELNRQYIETLPTLDPMVSFSQDNRVWIAEEDANPEAAATLRNIYQATVFEHSKAHPADPSKFYKASIWMYIANDVKADEMETSYQCDINFSAEWAKTFDKADTRRKTFTLTDGTTVEVPIMQSEQSGRYFVNDKFQAASIDFGNGAYEAIFVLPHESGTQKLNELIDSGIDELLTSEMTSFKLNIQIPRIAIGSLYKKTDVVVKAYDEEMENLNLGHISTALTLNESGAKIIASDNIVGYIDSGTKTFSATRPFLLFIRLKQTGICVLEAKVLRPYTKEASELDRI